MQCHYYDIFSHWFTLQWRHNGLDGVSNHQPHHCLLNRLFGRRSKKTSKFASLAFVRGIHRGLVNSPHKWPVMWKMFPFDDVIMIIAHMVTLLILRCSATCSKDHISNIFIWLDTLYGRMDAMKYSTLSQSTIINLIWKIKRKFIIGFFWNIQLLKLRQV